RAVDRERAAARLGHGRGHGGVAEEERAALDLDRAGGGAGEGVVDRGRAARGLLADRAVVLRRLGGGAAAVVVDLVVALDEPEGAALVVDERRVVGADVGAAPGERAGVVDGAAVEEAGAGAADIEECAGLDRPAATPKERRGAA